MDGHRARAALLQDPGDRLEGELGGVVLLAEVRQEDMPGRWRDDLCEEPARSLVGEVALDAEDTATPFGWNISPCR